MTKNYTGAEVIVTLGVQAFFDGGKRLLLQWSVSSNSLPGRIPARDAGEWDKRFSIFPQNGCVFYAHTKKPRSHPPFPMRSCSGLFFMRLLRRKRITAARRAGKT